MRMHGHGAHDDMSYVPQELFEEWERRDPIASYAARLVAEHGFGERRDRGDPRRRSRAEVDEGARRALEQPMPDPATARDGVFADTWEPLGDGNAPWSHGGRRSMSEMTYLEAISDGLREEMRRDENGVLPGRGHRRVRRRLQGDGRLPRGVRRASACSTRRWPRT